MFIVLWKELRLESPPPPRPRRETIDWSKFESFCWWLAYLAYVRRAATTLPKADKDLLINLASSILSAFFSASIIRSLPAKSIKLNFATNLASLVSPGI